MDKQMKADSFDAWLWGKVEGPPAATSGKQCKYCGQTGQNQKRESDYCCRAHYQADMRAKHVNCAHCGQVPEEGSYLRCYSETDRQLRRGYCDLQCARAAKRWEPIMARALEEGFEPIW